MIRNKKPPRNWKAPAVVWVIWDVNSGPLSDGRKEGIPNLRRISVKKKASHSRGSFVSRESFNPSRKCIYED